MKFPVFHVCALLIAGFATASTLLAQVVSDGQTNTLDNVTDTVTGTVTEGTNGSNTGLILTNGTLLTNTLQMAPVCRLRLIGFTK